MDRQTRILCLYLRAVTARDSMRDRWINAAIQRDQPAMHATASRFGPLRNRAKALGLLVRGQIAAVSAYP